MKSRSEIIEDRFQDFLHENNCYGLYYHNKNKTPRWDELRISEAFEWDYTNQGYEYWNNIDDMWKNEYRILIQSLEKEENKNSTIDKLAKL